LKKNKQENKQGANPKPKQTATFKKKKAHGGCFVCSSDDHWASACPDRKFKREEKKSVNMVIGEAEEGTSGVLLFFQSVIHLSDGWILGLMFMCVLTSLCFLLIRPATLEPY